MKKPLILALFTAAAAHADPLITKTSNTGFVVDMWVRSERCEVYTDKVVVEHIYGAANGFRTREVRPVQSADGILAMVAAVAADPVIESPNHICDGPSTLTTVKAPGASEEQTIFQTGGCGSTAKERRGGAARQLRDLVDLYCPTTYGIPEAPPTPRS